MLGMWQLQRESWKACFGGSSIDAPPLSGICDEAQAKGQAKKYCLLASTRTRLCRKSAGLNWHRCRGMSKSFTQAQGPAAPYSRRCRGYDRDHDLRVRKYLCTLLADILGIRGTGTPRETRDGPQ